MAIFNIAAGHGAGDSGAVYGSRLEKNDNLKMALAVEVELRSRGHTVRQYRYDDTVNCSAGNCRAWLEKNKADFSVVFHRNAYKPNQATGVEVWSFNSDAKSTQVAADMSATISNASALYNRGRKGNGAAWLSPNVPCCEPEIGFIDNASDNTKFDKSFNAIVKAVCDTLEEHYGNGTVADGIIAIGTTTNYLNIRTAPVNGAVLVSMPTGSKCNIFSIENGWAYLEYNGYKGYSSMDYMTIEYIKQEKPKEEEKPVVEEKPKEETAVKQIYRVRKSWDDAKDQIGAYSILENAIAKAEANKYNVYDNEGKLVWEYTEKNEPVETPEIEECEKPSENNSNGDISEDIKKEEITLEENEKTDLPPQSDCENVVGKKSLFDILNLIIKFLLNFFRRNK